MTDAKVTKECAESAGRAAYRSGLPCLAPHYGWGDREASWRVAWKKEQAAMGMRPANNVAPTESRKNDMSDEGMSPFEAKLRTILRDIRYKDWEFRIGKDAIGLFHLQVAFGARHVQSGTHQAWSGRKWRISTHMTASEIVQTALKAVLTAEEHEAREGFCYKGRAIFGPHLSVERLLELSGSDGATEYRQEG